MSDLEKTASDIRKFNERIYVPRHEYQPVEARAFRHLDLKFYDRVREALVAQGCTWLGDVEDVTLKGTFSDLRTFVRMLVSAEGTTCIGLYHPKPRLWLRLLLWLLRVKIGRTIDCESELSNGGYLVTSNAAEAGKLNPPPGFDIRYFPAETEPDTVFRAHRQRLQDVLAAQPGIAATTLRTAEDVLEMQHRMEAAKAAFRKGIGYVTVDELQRMGADPQAAAELKQAMDREKP